MIAGILMSGAMGRDVMLLPILYFLCGYTSGIVGKRRLAHNLPSFIVFSILGGGLNCLFGILSAVISGVMFGRSLPTLSWIWLGLIPVWALTVLFSPIPYLLVWGEKKLLRIDQ